jgi:hypothetical protein
MAESQGLLSSGWSMVGRNKRYIVWFYVLNVALGLSGTAAFSNQAHEMLDHSLVAERLVKGFDAGVFVEMLSRPEFGSTKTSGAPAIDFALLFFLLTALFLPGVLQGYGSTYRLPREDFFRACGRNLWRFIRLMIVAFIVFLIVGIPLFGIRGALVTSADKSTNELLQVYVSFIGLAVIFLVMATLRIWFDLAQADVVLSDQRAVRRSIAKGFRHTWRSLGRLLGSYVATTIVALVILAGGLWFWMKFIPPAGITRAILFSQLLLFLLLIPRFWQRGVAVTYYLQNMVEPIPVQLFTPAPVVAQVVVVEPAALPVIPGAPPEPQAL